MLVVGLVWERFGEEVRSWVMEDGVEGDLWHITRIFFLCHPGQLPETVEIGLLDLGVDTGRLWLM